MRGLVADLTRELFGGPQYPAWAVMPATQYLPEARHGPSRVIGPQACEEHWSARPIPVRLGNTAAMDLSAFIEGEGEAATLVVGSQRVALTRP